MKIFLSASQCFLEDVNVYDHNVVDTKTDTWEECSDLCEDEQNCFAWSYVTEQYRFPGSRQKCRLKDQYFMDDREVNRGVVTGIKDCSKCKSRGTLLHAKQRLSLWNREHFA